jgi:5-methylcytosine-specific restriction endonuclease McrA
MSAPKPAPARRRSRKKRGSGSPSGRLQLTSQPTSRNAYLDTKAWLLEEHGPVCAYCDRKFTAKVMTLDHVAPRRGQTAYDRRDNLVLACPGCNAAKRDQAPLAFLLAVRSRAASLLRYGSHLSPMLLDLARSLIPNGDGVATSNGSARATAAMSDTDDDESPYRD